jgi:integrase
LEDFPVSARPQSTPSYRHHKPSGQAVVTLGGRDTYLGKFGTPESRAEYDRVIAEWLGNGRQPGATSDLTINELIVRFITHIDERYESNEPQNYRLALRAVRKLYGPILAREFGPLKLKAVRQVFAESRLVRTQINTRVRRVVRMFKWAASEELLPSSVYQALKTVEGLRKGQGGSRESKPVKPVPDAHVDALKPYAARQVWAMIELQRLTGMRPGEVCMMRTTDVNVSGRTWEYAPESHKTEHHGKGRTIFIGPQAQAILRQWLRPELEAFLFQPLEAESERRAAQRVARKTKVQPSQQHRKKAKPRKQPGESYDSGSYRRAVAYAITRANRDRKARGEAEIPKWHPHQLRHNAGTRFRREFGLDAARAVLGHSTRVVTEIYAELDQRKAAEVMEKIG